MGCPSLSLRPLGTEGWDGQLGQRPTGGTLWNIPSLSVYPLGTEGWDRQLGQTTGTEACNRGLHGMSLTVYTSLGDRGMGRSWDRGLQRGLHGIVMYILLFSVPCYRTHGSPKFPLDSRWQYWTTLLLHRSQTNECRIWSGNKTLCAHAYKIRKWRPSQRTATTECCERLLLTRVNLRL